MFGLVKAAAGLARSSYEDALAWMPPFTLALAAYIW